MRKTVFVAAFASLAIWGCSSVPGTQADWGYSGAQAPEHWAKLSPDFSACAGRNQSPVDIRRAISAELAPIAPSYQPGGQEFVNNGHSVQVNYAPGSHLDIDGIRFELKQFHFHSPSENLVDGTSYALENHLVHADEDGNLLVLALLYEPGQPDAALDELVPVLPQQAGASVLLASTFDAAQLLPDRLDYYRLNGSLTTPPCSEGVRWLVLKQPLTASAAQVRAFAEAMNAPNNRPVQPVGARVFLQ